MEFIYGYLLGAFTVWCVYAMNLKPYLRWARDWVVEKIKRKP